MKYPVVEYFSSFQGEGVLIGMPATFLRLAGCNLSCSWCDSKETWDNIANVKEMTVEEIVSEFTANHNKNLFVITGGEPTLYDLVPLIEGIKAERENVLVAIETNGTNPTPENVDWVACSPKPPEYLIHGECFFQELKYVVDEEFTVDCIPEDKKVSCGTVWLQPCDGYDASYQKIVDLMDKYDYLRAGIQMHKIYGAR